MSIAEKQLYINWNVDWITCNKKNVNEAQSSEFEVKFASLYSTWRTSDYNINKHIEMKLKFKKCMQPEVNTNF